MKDMNNQKGCKSNPQKSPDQQVNDASSETIISTLTHTPIKVLKGITANRIEEKRQLKRRQKLQKIKQGALVILLLVSIGLISYAGSEDGINKTTAQGLKVGAFEPKVEDESDYLYNSFATVGKSSLKLSLPGKTGNVIGVGFHQAERREAIAIKPITNYFNRESTATVRNAILMSKVPVLFVMGSRGRGSAPTSAIDIAMVDSAEVYSPVDGVVTIVKTYYLYNKYVDYHIEIQPDGYPDLRVAIIHVDKVKVKEGQRVTRRDSLVGNMRALPQVTSQINKYLPKSADHIHMQVNPATVSGNLGS